MITGESLRYVTQSFGYNIRKRKGDAKALFRKNRNGEAFSYDLTKGLRIDLGNSDKGCTAVELAMAQMVATISNDNIKSSSLMTRILGHKASNRSFRRKLECCHGKCPIWKGELK